MVFSELRESLYIVVQALSSILAIMSKTLGHLDLAPGCSISCKLIAAMQFMYRHSLEVLAAVLDW
jgi:hypothetical protein